MSPELRPPDAGTANEWTFVGNGKVHAWHGGLPVVLGRPARLREALVAITLDAEATLVSFQSLVLTAHQTRALLEILPAAIAMAEQEDVDE